MTTSPPSPPHAVDRPELRARLDSALGAPLSLVVAPAGSGKTVLLSQWAESRPDRRFVWLDVDPVDDDPIQFCRRLLAGLRAISPSAGELGPLLTIGGGGLGRPLLESLVALLADHPGTVLVFDDLHNLSNRAIVNDLWWLADHLPADTHMVFSSRVDIRLAWSKHRLRYALVELRQAELAFDDEVAAEVLHRIAGVPASTATVTSVMDSTEGWAAGVQLTAIGMRHQDDPDQFARRLAGTDRFISEYLSEQVLSAQTENRRDLLLRLSVLDRMSPGLVESVLDVADAASLLDELERDSMFLVPIDGGHEWFRFHHLFRDLLRYRVRARYPQEEARILSAASVWHAEHGDLAAAIDCQLQARSWGSAMDLIMARGREVFERGQTTSMVRWLAAVPEAERRARPEAEALYGIVLGMSGQFALGEDVLRELAANDALEPGLMLIVQTYTAALVQFRAPASMSLEAARDALRLLREHPDVPVPDLIGLTDRALLQTLALGSRGRAYLFAGDLVAAHQWLARTLDSPGAQYSAYRVHLAGSMALVEAWAGRLGIAKALADEALELARDVGLLVHPAPADAYLALVMVAIHRGRPQTAAFALHEGGVRAASNQRTQLMWIAALEAVLAGAPRDPAAEPVSTPPSIVQDALDAATHRARRLSGETGAIARPPAGWTPLRVEAIAEALTARRGGDARALLEGSGFQAHEAVPISTVEREVLCGWLAHVEGRAAESRACLSAALELAGEHGIVSVFLWAGPEVIRLIANLPAASTPFRAEVLDRAREHFRPDATCELTEPLTDRERELLAYLPTRLTNAELAAKFFVSVNTIKTHMAHIYRKLDAPNRSAAVTRATELGLL
ncbi:LuxR family transcriptional regulator, maltose regulon positive regulatory protein [Microbacterium sp. cf046]|uniref:LuxR C-terminal-related transcriptional regulator n=1 Tax=Microbacterium sp. cf046 TaxID=1761803 RepID=UPI0008F1E719|nr:LuxR C-terminal-related transcriptional regulator [Microbacterium sp. cf046]SFS01255.1 LuxR family transcriptional regulator, maltose regulon positive regulatory protein [Microbacterium sp. cf046]